MPTKPTKGQPLAARSRVEAARNGPRVPLVALVAIGVVVLLVGAVAVIALTGDDGDGDATGDTLPPGEQAFGPVTVDGDPLELLPDGGDDPAVGQPAPGLVGETPSGEAIAIRPGEDGPMVLVFVAHWCPHCQVEVPHIVELSDDEGRIDGVPAIAVLTSSVEGEENYPPGEWLSREGWKGPAMVDSDPSDPALPSVPIAATTYGLTSYPFLVAIDGDGDVVLRTAGEKSDSELRAVFSAAAGGG